MWCDLRQHDIWFEKCMFGNERQSNAKKKWVHRSLLLNITEVHSLRLSLCYDITQHNVTSVYSWVALWLTKASVMKNDIICTQNISSPAKIWLSDMKTYCILHQSWMKHRSLHLHRFFSKGIKCLQTWQEIHPNNLWVALIVSLSYTQCVQSWICKSKGHWEGAVQWFREGKQVSA